MYGGIWTPPQSDKVYFLCVVYVQQASKHLPNIWGHPNIWEVSKHMGVSMHIQGASKHTGCPNIQGSIQTYTRVPKHGGNPSIQGVIQTYWVIQTYRGGSKYIGGVQTWGHPNIQEGVQIYEGHPNIQGVSKHMVASKHTGGCPNIWQYPNIWGHPNIQRSMQTYGGVQTWRGIQMYGGIWTPPQSDKACLFVVYVQQASKHLPNIHMDIQTYGGIQTYRGPSKHMGASKHTVGVSKDMGASKHIGHPNIWGCPYIWGCPNIWGHPNMQGASKHMGDPTKWVLPLILIKMKFELRYLFCNPRLINGKEDVILHHCIFEEFNFCFLTETWVKDEDCDSMNRLRKGEYCFRNIPREDKNGGDTGIIYRDGYNPSLMSKGRHVTFEFSQWQIKIGTKAANILIVYRPPYSRGNPYTGFKFVEEFGDF